MNLKRILLRKDTQETVIDDLDDDGKSETWSLPNLPELEEAHNTRAKRMDQIRLCRLKQTLEDGGKQGKGEWRVPLSNTQSIDSDDDDDDDISEDMNNRGKWNNSCEFLMSIISMSVGMGNFYRFPFVAYQNGGGAFLIPYLIVLTLVGRPMYLLELAQGQFCSYGQVKCWEMSPLFRGVGYGAALGSFCVVTYYSSVMAVTMYYLFSSFSTKLPWTECTPAWAGAEVCNANAILNATKHNFSTDPEIRALSEMFYEKQVLKEKAEIDDGIGLPDTTQSTCLLISWIIIYLVIVRGVQSSGKIAYFTTFYPYIIIIIMLITACTQEGSIQGMLYFITPDWTRIVDPQVWFAAVAQCFFSLSTGFGPIINYASYNPFHHNIYKDAMIVSFMDTLASLLAGVTVFATLGTISFATGKPISAVVDSGPGLVFVTFSDAISKFAFAPQLLAVLFFSMLLTLAVGSAVAWQMASISVICDQFPKFSTVLVTTVMCIVGFLISLIYVTPGGQFMLTLVDNFGGNVNIYILATLECIGIAWVYGLNNFCRDVEFMLKRKVGWYWKICWGFIIPVLLPCVIVYTFATAKRLEHNGHPFPDSAIISGWTLTAVSVLFVPVLAIYALVKEKGTFVERFKTCLKPTSDFGPRKPQDKERWELFKGGIIANGGPPSDSYQLPPGETPEDNSLPKWLTAKEDGAAVSVEVCGS